MLDELNLSFIYETAEKGRSSADQRGGAFILPTGSNICQLIQCAQLDTSSDEEMRKIHHYLLELNIITGNLVCTETGRKFPIQAGIPNMLLVQDEL